MSNAPSFQFYPSDWLANTDRRRCSLAASGALIDCICILHQAPQYGAVRYSLAELARTVGAPQKLLQELVDKGLLRGTDKGTCEPLVYVPRSGRRDGTPVELIPATAGPIWYVARMVRDQYVRTVRGEAGRFAGAADASLKGAPKPAPKPPKSDGSSSSSSSSSSFEFNTEDSVADATGANAPTDRERVFALGTSLLLENGKTEKAARSLLAMFSRDYGDAKVLECLQACAASGAIEKASWLVKAMPAKKQQRSFTETDYSEGLDANGRIIN